MKTKVEIYFTFNSSRDSFVSCMWIARAKVSKLCRQISLTQTATLNAILEKFIRLSLEVFFRFLIAHLAGGWATGDEVSSTNTLIKTIRIVLNSGCSGKQSHQRARKNNPPLLTFRCFSRSHLCAISKSERLEQVIIGPTRMWFSLSLWLFCPCIERVRLRTFRVPLLSGNGGGVVLWELHSRLEKIWKHFAWYGFFNWGAVYLWLQGSMSYNNYWPAKYTEQHVYYKHCV